MYRVSPVFFVFLKPDSKAVIPDKCNLEEHSGYLYLNGHKEPSISKSTCKILSDLTYSPTINVLPRI